MEGGEGGGGRAADGADGGRWISGEWRWAKRGEEDEEDEEERGCRTKSHKVAPGGR